MKKIYCFKYEKHTKTKKPTFSYGWNEILVFSNSCAKCGDNKDKICKEEENIEMFKIIGLFENLNE